MLLGLFGLFGLFGLLGLLGSLGLFRIISVIMIIRVIRVVRVIRISVISDLGWSPLSLQVVWCALFDELCYGFFESACVSRKESADVEIQSFTTLYSE